MSTYLVNGTEIHAEGADLQTLLEHCYGAKVRPLCACKRPGVPMYISKIAGVYHIKRMPDSGAEHHVACESYDPPPELSGLGEVMGSAIKEDVESGMTSLRFDFALTKTAGRVAPTPSDVEHDSVKSESNKLTIRALLHYLWDRSKLTHWQPTWQGKRNWGTVYKQLIHAAHGNQAKGLALADCLYVPQPFFVDRKDEIAGQRLAFINQLIQTDGKARRLGIVVGEVKAIENARYGFKMVLKQVPDYHFILNEDVLKRVHKRFANEFALWEAFENTHMVAIATFDVGPSGLAKVEEIALMLTTENWIPFADLNEKNLIDRISETHRRFIKGMRYNMSSKRPLACVELVDTSPAPTAMFITPADTDDAYKQDLAALTDKSNLLQWVWDISTAMPPIPERTSKPMPQ